MCEEEEGNMGIGDGFLELQAPALFAEVVVEVLLDSKVRVTKRGQ